LTGAGIADINASTQIPGDPMQTAKKEINKLLRRLPEDCSMEDIQYHIYVLQKIERGLQQADEGKVISAEALENRMRRLRL
jgi:hypothetical protein